MTGTTPAGPLRELDRVRSAVLVVDDDEAIRHALSRFLIQERLEVHTAATAAEALDAIAAHQVGCVVLDIRLPDGQGTDLIPRLLQRSPATAIVMLTAVADAATAARCLELGAMDYLVKPVDLQDVLGAVRRALRRREATDESRQINQWLTEEVARRTAELHEERELLRRHTIATLETLVNALEAKDRHLRGHSARVADLAGRVAEAYGLDPDGAAAVRMAGRLHDIGKIGVPDAILNKEGALSNEEFDHIRAHPAIGAQILAPLSHLGEVIAFVRGHHERWDGTGYPDGLAGEAIPVGARILAAVEVFDALTTSRPYQARVTPVEAVRRMNDLAGTVVEPAVVRALARVTGGDGPGAVTR